MFKRRVKKLKAQSLIEIVMAIALAAFFMGITVLGLSLTSDKYLSYAEKKNALDLLKFQKSKNELNLGKFLADNKSLDGWSTLGAFPFQGAHQTFSYLNYNTGSTSTSYVLNEEKKFFANDTPLSY